jgi:hypothetical protein
MAPKYYLEEKNAKGGWVGTALASLGAGQGFPGSPLVRQENLSQSVREGLFRPSLTVRLSQFAPGIADAEPQLVL